MPIQIPNDLPAAETLKNENIFVMNQTRAETQHIRPLEIVLLNLMPTKIVTETAAALGLDYAVFSQMANTVVETTTAE